MSGASSPWDASKRETGAASLLIDLSDGVITVTHGDDKIVLGIKAQTRLGDWSRLCDFLRDDLGVDWIE